MIRSMTGFGSAIHESEQRRISVEARSVNHRYLKIQSKLPRTLASMESEVEARARGALRRGALTLMVRVEESARSRAQVIDYEVARQYHRDLSRLAQELGLRGRPHGVQSLVGLPGVMTDAEGLEHISEGGLQKDVLTVVEQALQTLVASREAEGANLVSALRTLASELSRDLSRLSERAPEVPRITRDRLRQRVQSLLDGAEPEIPVSDGDLLREIALIADRCDLTEELDRLGSHIERFGHILDTKEEVGRELDFLLQEMLRETNTIGSKANDTELAHLVVDLKTSIERMKEQVQNLE